MPRGAWRGGKGSPLQCSVSLEERPTRVLTGGDHTVRLSSIFQLFIDTPTGERSAIMVRASETSYDSTARPAPRRQRRVVIEWPLGVRDSPLIA